MYCTNCKEEKEGDAAFCDACGTPLKKRCEKCGTVLSVDAMFCTECGNTVGNMVENGQSDADEELKIRFCSECGSELLGDSSCPKCGNEYPEEAVTPIVATKEDATLGEHSQKVYESKKEDTIQITKKQLMIVVVAVMVLIVLIVGWFLKKEKESSVPDAPVIENTNMTEAETEENDDLLDEETIRNAEEITNCTVTGEIWHENDGSYLVLNNLPSVWVYDVEKEEMTQIDYVNSIKLLGPEEATAFEDVFSNGTVITVSGKVVYYENLELICIYPDEVIEGGKSGTENSLDLGLENTCTVTGTIAEEVDGTYLILDTPISVNAYDEEIADYVQVDNVSYMFLGSMSENNGFEDLESGTRIKATGQTIVYDGHVSIIPDKVVNMSEK